MKVTYYKQGKLDIVRTAKSHARYHARELVHSTTQRVKQYVAQYS